MPETLVGAAPRRSIKLSDLWFTLPFLALYWLNLAHHDLWLDELNAWGISAASGTLRAMFANVHYEGHPWLWYFILWVPSRFTHAPVAMKWTQALIGTAIYLVIGLLSPFTRWQKVLVFLNYFVAFEYTVLSRTYGVMLLFALLYAWRRSSRPRAFAGNLALLGALANTDLTGILLSGSLLLEYCVSQWPDRRSIAWSQVTAALGIYAALLLFSLHSLTLAPDISWATTGHLFANARSLPHLVHSVGDVTVGTYWPFPRGYPAHFWNTDVGFIHGVVVFIPFVLAAYAWIFRRSLSLLVLLGATTLAATSFAHLVYIGYPRHWGLSVVGFLLALWILCAKLPANLPANMGADLGADLAAKNKRRALSRFAYVLLAIGALKGVTAMAASWTHPFSETGRVAQWLRDQHLDRQPIAGASDYDLAGVAEQLQRPVYFLNCNCVDDYMKFAHRRDGMTPEMIPGRIAQAYDALHATRLILIMDTPLKPQDANALAQLRLNLQPLAYFSGSEDEFTFSIYQVQRVEP